MVLEPVGNARDRALPFKLSGFRGCWRRHPLFNYKLILSNVPWAVFNSFMEHPEDWIAPDISANGDCVVEAEAQRGERRSVS